MSDGDGIIELIVELEAIMLLVSGTDVACSRAVSWAEAEESSDDIEETATGSRGVFVLDMLFRVVSMRSREINATWQT